MAEKNGGYNLRIEIYIGNESQFNLKWYQLIKLLYYISRN